jgi:hypothetical protein
MDDIDEKNREIFGQLKEEISTLEGEVRERERLCEDLKSKSSKLQIQLTEMGELEKQCTRNKVTPSYSEQTNSIPPRFISPARPKQAILIESARITQESLNPPTENLNPVNRPEIATHRQISPPVPPSQPRERSAHDQNCQTRSHVHVQICSVKDLKLKYAELLKQATGSSNNISVNSIPSTFRHA